MRQFHSLTLLFALLATQVFAATGMIKIKAEPGPAIITIDGKRYQNATEQTQVYELSPGRHIIRAEKQHYNSQQKTVTIRANEVAPTAIFRFEKASGFKVDRPDETTAGQGRGDLTIITDKPGATVVLNGSTVNADVTPITVRELGEGEWDVEVRLQGKTLKDVVLIKPGQLAKVRFFFDQNKEGEYKRKIEAERKAREVRAAEKETEERLQLIENKIIEYRKSIKHNDLNFSIEGKNIGNTSVTVTSAIKNLWGDKARIVKMSSKGRELRTSGEGYFRDVIGNEHHVSFKYYIDVNMDYDERRNSSSHGYWMHEFEVVIDGVKTIDKKRDTINNGNSQLQYNATKMEFSWGTIIPNAGVGHHGSAIPRGCHDYAYVFVKLAPPNDDAINTFRKTLEKSKNPANMALPTRPGPGRTH